MTSLDEKIEGTIYGLAFGDAFGWPVEFRPYDYIKAKGFQEFPNPAVITDDTQMSIYALNAILNNWELMSQEYLDENAIALVFAESFAIWFKDPNNNRAPGGTCMSALEIFSHSDRTNGYVGTQKNSKGCGANMRNPWFGVLPLNEQRVEELSFIQSAITHSHPLALSSATITALLVHKLFNGSISPEQLYETALELTQTLKPTANRLSYSYVLGLESLELFLKNNKANYEKFMNQDESEDYNICDFFGEGWVAEEALLNALAGASKLYRTPEEALRRLANSGGDSDSLAAIGGAFIGATGNNWHKNWKANLEPFYETQLADLTQKVKVLNRG